MKDKNAEPAPLPEYIVEAIQDGYVFECSCGELYNTIDAAWDCRKCRRYLGRSASEVYNHLTEEWTHERDEWAFLDGYSPVNAVQAEREDRLLDSVLSSKTVDLIKTFTGETS